MKARQNIFQLHFSPLRRLNVRSGLWPRGLLSAAVLSLVVLTTGHLQGQERVRIVESPRTAMRSPSPVTLSPRKVASEIEQPAQGGGTVHQPAARTAPGVGGQTEHFVTEMQDQYRTVYIPVIENQTEPTAAWWDPLGLSTRNFRARPVVRWEARIEKVRVPVRYREFVSEVTKLPRQAVTVSSQDATRTVNANRPERNRVETERVVR